MADPELLAQERAVIVVHRAPGGFHNRLRANILKVDGHEVANLRNGRTVEVAVLSGRHRVELMVDWCASSPAREVTLPQGQRCYLVNRARPYFDDVYALKINPNEYPGLELSAAPDCPSSYA
ncbi:hypothetical protein ACW2Q0_29425 [Nocardia sp. R16R-3T]